MGTAGEQEQKGLFRRAISRISATDEEVEALDLKQKCTKMGATLIADTQDRQLVDLVGTVRSVTLRPVGGVPAVEADLYDGSGSVKVVFLGRRHVSGVEPGRMMEVKGRLSRDVKRALIYNPAYTLLPPGAAQS